MNMPAFAPPFMPYPYQPAAYQPPNFLPFGLTDIPSSFAQPTVQEIINIPDDELSRPYVPNAHTKFSARIANFKIPPKTKMPVNVKTYDRMGDPDDHLELFMGAAKVDQRSLPIWCHMFAQTLIGPARLWFNSLPDGSIDTFEDFSKSFLANFMQQKRYTKNPVELHNIKQKDDEELRVFMERYKKEGLSIGGATEQMRVSGFIHGVRPRQLIEELNGNIPQSMEEAMDRAEAFLRGKEAAQVLDAKKQRSSSWKQPPHQPRGTPRFQPFVER
jgi:hypothetical protein